VRRDRSTRRCRYERKHFSLGGGFNNRNLFGYRGDGNSLGRVTATDDGVGVSMETFFDRLSWKLLLIAVPFSMAIIVPGIYLIWQGVGK
jgi:hypothetical protein